MLCIQSFVIKTPHHNILVDACVGNHKPRPTRPFWHMMNSDRFEKGLAAVGLTVDDIDYVMCTHLHTDHVGWNTKLENGRWVPTFPKAKYIMADRELEHWTEREKDNPVERALDHRLGAADHRRQARADRQKRFRLQRRGTVHPDPRPHHRPFLGAGRQRRRRRADHRRHDSFAAAGQISRARHDGRLRFAAGRQNPAQSVRPLLRRADASCARRIFRRPRPAGCGAGATASNSSAQPIETRHSEACGSPRTNNQTCAAKSTPGATELGSCLTDATRGRSRPANRSCACRYAAVRTRDAAIIAAF